MFSLDGVSCHISFIYEFNIQLMISIFDSLIEKLTFSHNCKFFKIYLSLLIGR